MQPVRTALLSFGMSGKVFHAPFIALHPGFTLTGAWERSVKLISGQYPGTRSYASLEEVLNDPDVDLVIVNTPTHSHFDYARQALKGNKHVLVEKAFTTTVAEAEELKALAIEQEKKLAVFQNRRWDSDFKTVQQIVKQGLLGDLVEVTFSFDRYNPALSPKLHKENPGPGAGIVYDLAPHLIDQALVLFGMPNAVFGDFRKTRSASSVEDYFEILLYYADLRVRLRAGYFVREPVPSYILHGSKGSFLKSRGDVQEANLLQGLKPDSSGWGEEPEEFFGLLHTEKAGKVVREKVKTLPGNYMDFFDGLHLGITGNKPVPVTADDGIRAMRVIEGSFVSNREKRVVNL